MASIEWLAGAKHDLERLYEFIEPHSADAAARAIQTIVKGANELADYPFAGKPWAPDTNYRELIVPFGARAYALRYRVMEERVIIVRVWHGLEDHA